MHPPAAPHSGPVDEEVVYYSLKSHRPVVSDEGAAAASSDPGSAPGVLIMELSTMASLPDDVHRVCPITLEEFDRASVDFLPEDACFLKGRKDLCVGKLPCGHRFHALSILSHMVLTSMKCPICR